MKAPTFLTLLMLSTTVLFGQKIQLGFLDSIHSKVLNENRKLLIQLPKGYDASDKSYPVLYRLDGDLDLFAETVGTIHRLSYMDESIPEMIVVMLENTNRNRDMMPTKTKYFDSEPGAENFKVFIEKELVPYINQSFRTSNEKFLYGQSLSAIFTLYCFLTSPDAFDSYIACSGAFLDFESYFQELTNNYLAGKRDKTIKLFLTHGDKDPLDPDRIHKKQLFDFTEKINSKGHLVCELKTYREEGHVPFQSLYHGLKFLYHR